MRLGDHVIAQWSRVQPRIALSSAEAELYAAVKGISELLGVVTLGKELWGNEWGGRACHQTDASACRFMELRRGAGSVKHLSLKVLWIQEAVRENDIEVVHIGRLHNAAHLLASPARPSELEGGLRMLSAWSG